MTKEQIRNQLMIHLKNLGLSEIEIKKSVSKKKLEKMINDYDKKNWFNDNYKQNMISILFDNLDTLKGKSIEILNEFYVK